MLRIIAILANLVWGIVALYGLIEYTREATDALLYAAIIVSCGINLYVLLRPNVGGWIGAVIERKRLREELEIQKLKAEKERAERQEQQPIPVGVAKNF